MDKNSLVAAKIKEFRIEKNITQKVIASHLGLSENAYSRIENGITQLTINNLFKLTEVLDVSIEKILEIGSKNSATNNKTFIIGQFNEGTLNISLTPQQLSDIKGLFENPS